MTKEIWNRANDPEHGALSKINFKGMMVGNPYVDHYINTMTQVDALYGHGVVEWPLYRKWLDHCQDPRKYLKLVRPLCYSVALFDLSFFSKKVTN